jgi:Zn-dependent protease/CBS domain-containing protein
MSAGGTMRGLPIARIFGITVRIHASWLLIFFLMTWSLAVDILPMSNLNPNHTWFATGDVTQYHNDHPKAGRVEIARALDIELWPEWQYWALGAVGALGLFACVLLHELSHSLVAKRNGIEVKGITLFLFGGVSELGGDATGPGAEAWRPDVEWRVSAAGPLMSIALGVASGVLYFGLVNVLPGQVMALLFYSMVINLMLAVFNLLPGFPLDGGRLLRAFLWKRSGDLSRATITAVKWGRGVGLAFIVMGIAEFWLMWELKGQLELIGPLWMVLIGWFLRQAAESSIRQVAMRDAFAGLKVRDVTQPGVITAPPDLALDRLVDEYFYTYRFRSFPVLEDGRLSGVISLQDLQAVPRLQWPAVQVRQAMHQVRPENLVHPDDDLGNVFQKMAEENRGHLPVVEDGRLVGIITRHDIMTLIQLKTDLGGHARPAGGGAS